MLRAQSIYIALRFITNLISANVRERETKNGKKLEEAGIARVANFIGLYRTDRTLCLVEEATAQAGNFAQSSHLAIDIECLRWTEVSLINRKHRVT